MAGPAPPLVTVHVWTVPVGRIPSALAAVAADRIQLAAVPGLGFARLLGCSGSDFTLRGARLTTWLLIGAPKDRDAAAALDASPPVRRWAARSREQWRAELRPLAVRGRWSGRQPFNAGGREPTAATRGPVAAVTRARLALPRARRFWRAVPDVAADLAGRPGLLFATGMSAAPVLTMGTFSVWSTERDLRAFAYERAAHNRVREATPRESWYREELFARFAVTEAAGTLAGQPLDLRP